MKKAIFILGVLMLLLFVTPAVFAVEEDGTDAPNPTWINFTTEDPGAIPPGDPFTHTQDFDLATDTYLYVWIWDTGTTAADQDDVVEIYVDGVYIGTANSTDDPAGGIAKKFDAGFLSAGTHTLTMIITYSEKYNSMWAKRYEPYTPSPAPELAWSLPLMTALLAAAYFLFSRRLNTGSIK